MYLLLVTNLANVDRVAQDVVESTAREGFTTTNPPVSIGSLFANNTLFLQPNRQLPHRSRFQIFSEDCSDRGGFVWVHNQCPVLGVVPHGYGTPHPHALPF